MKKIDPDDPKLTAYALGELDVSERAAIEAALQAHPECHARVDEIRQTAALLSSTLASEPCPPVRGIAPKVIEAALGTARDDAESAETSSFVAATRGGSEGRAGCPQPAARRVVDNAPYLARRRSGKIIAFPRRRIFAIAGAIAASIVGLAIWQPFSNRDIRQTGHSPRGRDNENSGNIALLPPSQAIQPAVSGTNMGQALAGSASSVAANKVPAATLALREAPLSQVIDLYETLGGRTVVRPNNLPETRLNIQGESDMTRPEAVQALETILAMNQITMIPQGEKFVKAVSQHQAPAEASSFNEYSVALDPTAAQQNGSHFYTLSPNAVNGVSVSRTDSSFFVQNNNEKFANSSQPNATTVAAGTGYDYSGGRISLGETYGPRGSGFEGKGPATLAGGSGSVREQQKYSRGLSASAAPSSPGTVYSVNSAGVAEHPSKGVLGARFSPDGKKVIITSGDEQLRVWDAKTGKELAEARQEIVAYAPFVENGFQSVAQQPLSTFSIDVDTASYANVRRFLNQNTLPPRAAIRIEEMINYFSYNHPQPKGDDPFAASIEVAGCPWSGEHRLVRVALKGREMPQDKRPPSNFVFLIDVSGSMQPAERLPLIKQGLRMLVKKMNERDRVAIVVYASTSGVRLPSTSCAEKEKILAAIDALEAGGSTNGGEGIQQAYATAKKDFIKGGVNRVILCTDGDFNVGITDQNELVRLIQEQARSGIFLSALGVGTDNYKDALMQKLADKGNGNYHYIDALEEAQKVLIEQMNGTLVTIAKDVKIQIEFNPAQVSAYRLIGYEKRMLRKEDFNNDRKDAGEIGAGHTITAFYEIVPAGRAGVRPVVDALKYQSAIAAASYTANEFSNELLTLKLRYKQPDGNTSKLLEFPATDNGASYGKASADFKFATAVVAFGMILRDSEYKGSANFDGILELAEESKGADVGGYRAEFINLVKKAKSLQ